MWFDPLREEPSLRALTDEERSVRLDMSVSVRGLLELEQPVLQQLALFDVGDQHVGSEAVRSCPEGEGEARD